MQRRTLGLIVLSAALVTIMLLIVSRPDTGVRAADRAAAAEMTRAHDATLIVGPGRVEPISEEIAVSGEVPGRLRAVRVDEGDRVTKGQVVAEVEPAEYRARLAAARAALSMAQSRGAAPRQRLAERGARGGAGGGGAGGGGRAAGRGGTPAARDALRRGRDRARGAGARGTRRARRRGAACRTARACPRGRRRRARRRARPARAAVALAEAQVDEAAVLLEKTLVRSPVDGLVLRRHLRPGESLAVLPVPSPIVTLADVSALRVRVDVDESDIGGLRVGQAAWVTADAYGSRRFAGRVVRVGEMLGRARIRTDDPAERIDHKVLETLIELEASARLPIGLRVDAFITRVN